MVNSCCTLAERFHGVIFGFSNAASKADDIWSRPSRFAFATTGARHSTRCAKPRVRHALTRVQSRADAHAGESRLVVSWGRGSRPDRA